MFDTRAAVLGAAVEKLDTFPGHATMDCGWTCFAKRGGLDSSRVDREDEFPKEHDNHR